jgi:3,4-dihydroxy 2-butanone 4-phosphate synthase/GTP cyclohydrolase II
MRRVGEEGGAILYLRQEGRGIGLFEKVKAYTLQDRGMDTLEANLALDHEGDRRRFGSAAAVLKKAGYTQVRLLTNNPEKVAALERAGIDVVERLPLHVGHSDTNDFYLTTKFERMGHLAPQRRV